VFLAFDAGAPGGEASREVEEEICP
jgi:hypothetical protein